MDQKTSEEIADLYNAKVFTPSDIAARYGVPHQRVVAIADRVQHERLIARLLRENPSRSFSQKPGRS